MMETRAFVVPFSDERKGIQTRDLIPNYRDSGTVSALGEILGL